MVIDEGEILPWYLPKPNFNSLIDELILRITEKKRTYIAKCPLAYIEGDPGSVWSLGNGLSIHILTNREKASYLSRAHNKILSHDWLSRLSFDTGILEIVDSIQISKLQAGDPPKNGQDILEELITDKIDIVKWALSFAFQRNTSLIEGTVIVDNVFGSPVGSSGVGVFCREANNRQGTVYELTQEKVNQSTDLINKASKYVLQSNDLKQAFWYWGRSCLAHLERDIILDSTIGLEHLLVPNSGDTGYRFRLHGAALLSSSSEEALENNGKLKKIYNARSTVAHGNHKNKVENSYLARVLLRNAIQKIIDYFEVGSLTPSEKIAQQIEEKILKQSFFNKI